MASFLVVICMLGVVYACVWLSLYSIGLIKTTRAGVKENKIINFNAAPVHNSLYKYLTPDDISWLISKGWYYPYDLPQVIRERPKIQATRPPKDDLVLANGISPMFDLDALQKDILEKQLNDLEAIMRPEFWEATS